LAFDREKTLQTAQKYIDRRKYDRAIQEYQKLVEHEPNDARTLLRIGDLQARLGNHAEAIATYDRVALYYSGKGFSLKAVAVLKQIGELIDRHAPHLADQYGHVLPKLAQTYAELGLTNDALATYDAVARRLQNRGRDRDAVEIIRRMVSLDRQNALPYLRLAEALCRVSRVDEAMEHFWTSAQLLTQQGRPDDALKVLERILHFRQDPRIARVAAELYLTKGTREAGLSALSRLQISFDADPRDLSTLALLAQAFDLIGQSSKGVEVYKEMVRIAAETGQRDLHARYLQHLLAVAPRDEQVRALAAMHGVSNPSRAPLSRPRTSAPPESIAEDDIEFIDEEAVAEADDAEPGDLADTDGPTRVTPGLGERGRQRVSSAPELRVHRGRTPEASAPPASEFLRKALVDAESFRGLKLYGKASASLRHALTVAPHSIELRAALEQVLLEAGDHAGAIEQMLTVAQLYIDRGSLSAAEAELIQVLELAPGTAEARRLLDKIESLSGDDRRSRRPPPEGRPSKEEPPASQAEHEAFELRARITGRIPPPAAAEDAPLPAYQLEDDDLMAVTPPTGSAPKAAPAPAAPAVAAAPAQARGGAAAAPAAPAGKGARAGTAEVPLPQFTLDSGLHHPPEVQGARGESGPSAPSSRPEALRSVSPDSAARQPVSRRDSIRAALDEAEFFESRGLYQDASMILRDRLEQYPGEAALIEAIARIEPKLNTESGTRDVGRLSDQSPDDPSLASVEPPASAAPPLAAAPDVQSTRGKELRVQFTTDGTTQGGPIIDADADLELMDALEQPREEQQIDVDEVFAKFKQGVKAQISDSDSATHYDLGVAYKEMGLLADAAREFELASSDPKRECNCLAMMGMMYRERGELDRAAEAYVKALNATHKTVGQEVSLYYDLGVIYEMKNDPDEAIYYFQRITRRDPGYRDVSQRLKALLPRSRRFSQPARAINDDKDFDSSFDDLYEPE
jgi:tetratricopeptide (TPR) repeat protein